VTQAGRLRDERATGTPHQYITLKADVLRGGRSGVKVVCQARLSESVTGEPIRFLLHIDATILKNQPPKTKIRKTQSPTPNAPRMPVFLLRRIPAEVPRIPEIETLAACIQGST
jgi:hypothetical protein